MLDSAPYRKPVRVFLAMLFATATVLYSALWVYNAGWQAAVELGYSTEYVRSTHCQHVTSITPGSPAQQAGMKAGDCILTIGGKPLENANSLIEIYAKYKPGDAVELTIQRPGVSVPIATKAVFRARGLRIEEGGLTAQLGSRILNSYPVLFLVVGLAVLFLRLEDRNAWLLALLFASFITAAYLPNLIRGPSPHFQTFAMAYRAIFSGLLGALFYFFFAVFPVPWTLDRRLPWLKWAGLALGLCVAVPGLGVGGPAAPGALVRLVGQKSANIFVASYEYGFLALGIAALVSNALLAPSAEARRKLRVILWGTLVGVPPAVLARAAIDFSDWELPYLAFVPIVLLLFLLPLSFAYAVVKHQVLEIPVLLQRSARYVLVQRGFLFLHIFVSAAVTLLFAWGLARVHLMNPVGLMSAVMFGSVLALGGLRVHRVTSRRIDRAFFRNAYDARMILEDLVEKTRTATDRQGLAALLEHHLRQALQPSFLAIYLETSDHQLSRTRGEVPPELETLSTGDPLLLDLASRGRPREVPEESRGNSPARSLIRALQPECLVPMLGRDSRLVGMLVLGPRRSEEPYSREDKNLLATVANQAGVAIEAIRLGEKIAERIEAERRAAQEMEYAKQVQARLFPQKLPALRSLDYVGGCIQARQVGGDYYDFLELKPGRVALVLADIAGKGISGALLMANLQANLRSQYATAVQDLPRLLKSVNQLFYQNTSASSYATLFFGDYDDRSRELRYVNCGHLPPLLFRDDGTLERLQGTATVLGLFEEWDCAVGQLRLGPADTLLLYTDGVTEATNPAGEEFGEARLVETLRAHRHLPVASLLHTIVETLEKFSSDEQADDVTLVVAKCRTAAQ